MNTKIDLIKAVPLFAGLSKRQLASVAQVADELDVPAGRELTREGEIGKEFIVLIDGVADVTRDGELLNTLGPGDFLGEIAVITGHTRTATVTTRTQSKVLVLNGPALRSLFHSRRSVRAKLIDATSHRLAA